MIIMQYQITIVTINSTTCEEDEPELTQVLTQAR